MELAKKVVERINGLLSSVCTITPYREPLVGYASAQDNLFYQMKEVIGPHHLLPQEMLPDAKTVIAFFLPFGEEIVKANRQEKEVAKEWAKAYEETNQLIGDISVRLKNELEMQGIKATFQKATHNFNEIDLTASWSHKSAAFVAGLGTFGVNKMLITPAGCAGRFGSLVISAEIPPSPRPSEEYCLYYREGKCLACVKNCPVGALSIEEIDKKKCYKQLLQVAALFPGLCDVCGKCNIGPCALKRC